MTILNILLWKKFCSLVKQRRCEALTVLMTVVVTMIVFAQDAIKIMSTQLSLTHFYRLSVFYISLL